jgi:PLP dependent protein
LLTEVIDWGVVEEGLAAVRDRIAVACSRSGRRPQEVRIVAVTKTLPAEAVRAAVAAGIDEFGENYVNELENKRPAAPEATWHFIGRVQSNKARRIQQVADMVHTLEPGRGPAKLAAAARSAGTPVAGLVEVDFTGRRVGIAPAAVPRFVTELSEEPGLDLRGLMTVAPPGEDPRPAFSALRELRDGLRVSFPGFTELSMGMSADLESAVEEGATMVRVGTALFGNRPAGRARSGTLRESDASPGAALG